MRSILIFTLKVWLATASVGSIIFVMYAILNSPSKDVDWNFIPTFLVLTILLSMLLSLPTLVIFYTLAYGLAIVKLNYIWIKASLTIIGLLGCALTLLFLTENKSLFNPASLVFTTCYAIPLISSVWFCKLTVTLD